MNPQLWKTLGMYSSASRKCVHCTYISCTTVVSVYPALVFDTLRGRRSRVTAENAVRVGTVICFVPEEGNAPQQLPREQYHHDGLVCTECLGCFV